MGGITKVNRPFRSQTLHAHAQFEEIVGREREKGGYGKWELYLKFCWYKFSNLLIFCMFDQYPFLVFLLSWYSDWLASPYYKKFPSQRSSAAELIKVQSLNPISCLREPYTYDAWLQRNAENPDRYNQPQIPSADCSSSYIHPVL